MIVIANTFQDGSSRWFDKFLYSQVLFPGEAEETTSLRKKSSYTLLGNNHRENVYFVPSTEVKATKGSCQGSPISCPVMLLPAVPPQEDAPPNDAIGIQSPLPYVVVYFHGNEDSLEGSLSFIKAIHKSINCTIIAVEYPGYGITKPHFDRTNPSDIDQWAEDVFLWTCNTLHIPPDRVIPFGYSIGNGPAARMAEIMKSKYDVAAPGLILHAPYRSIKQMGRVYFGTIGELFAPNIWNVEATLKNLDSCNTHLLISHSQKDEMIPYAHGQYLAENYTGSVSSHFPKGRLHFDWVGAELAAVILEFLQARWKVEVAQQKKDPATPRKDETFLQTISKNAVVSKDTPPEYIYRSS